MTESSFRRCQSCVCAECLQCCIQRLKSPREARWPSGGSLQRGASDVENAMLEFGHPISHATSVRGEKIAMAIRWANNRAFQSQADAGRNSFG
jgi:hypothetical protein